MTNVTKPLSPDAQKAILAFNDVLKDLPPSPRRQEVSSSLLAGGLVRCPFTDRLYESSQVEILHDQVGPITNLLHPDNRSDVKGMCSIACIQCREVVNFAQPGTDSDGFKLDPSLLYHIAFCPKCEPEKFEGRDTITPLIEKQLFLKFK